MGCCSRWWWEKKLGQPQCLVKGAVQQAAAEQGVAGTDASAVCQLKEYPAGC
jgi:hypothetical protein